MCGAEQVVVVPVLRAADNPASRGFDSLQVAGLEHRPIQDRPACSRLPLLCGNN